MIRAYTDSASSKNRRPTMRARGPRTAPLSGAGGLDSQRSGAEMGDSRSGLLLRPIAPPNWSFSWFWVLSVLRASLVPPAAGNASRWAADDNKM